MVEIVLSSGHSQHVRGASGYLDEVDEARKVVDHVTEILRKNDIAVDTFHDDISTTQDENLKTIVDYHNSRNRNLDVSVHFNCFETTIDPMGTEVLYVTQEKLACDVSLAIARAGSFIDRGGKKRTDLYFLNNTEAPAILIETCFVDSETDADLYRQRFHAICHAIAESIGRRSLDEAPAAPYPARGKSIPANQTGIIATVFGGESDYNVSAYDESLVLNDTDLYVALPCRFEGERPQVHVHNPETGKSAIAEILDVGPWLTDDDYWNTGARPLAETCWEHDEPLPRGPNEGEVPNGAGIDLSPALADVLGVSGKGGVDWEFVE